MSERIHEGPPGPDVDTEADDAAEVFEVEDNYERTNGVATITTLLNTTIGETVFDADHYTDEWWKNREQELANEQAKNVARTERDRMRRRAEIMVHAEGQTGLRGRFPRWAVENAQSVRIETLAMLHSRRFLAAAEQESAAGARRMLGERDDDDGPPREPSRILVLAGGTGAGKTTAAAWIALKGDDTMPGFILASELERRGRYDKDLRSWLPERSSLVIDDLGAELLDGKGVFRSWLDEIVDAFYSSKRRLILTTNLKAKITDEHRAECAEQKIDPEPQFRERYGDRVRSRIFQVGQWAGCGNTDLREVAP